MSYLLPIYRGIWYTFIMSRLDEAAKAVLKECFFNNDEERLAAFVAMASEREDVNSETPYMMAAVLITEA